MHPELEKFTNRDFYTQGIAAKPGIVTLVGGLNTMQESLGFSYEAIIGIYKNGYCEWNYLEDDFLNHSNKILGSLEKNPNYLKEKRELYNRQFEEVNKLFQKAHNASNLSDQDIFELLSGFGKLLGTTVGTSHLLESISLRLERDLRKIMEGREKGKALNKDFSILTSPATRSFISKKDEALWKIKNSAPAEKEKLAEKFIQDFFWIKTSYSGSEFLTVSSVLKEASNASRPVAQDFEELVEEKKTILEKYGFSEREKQLVVLAEFLIDWQDDRKEKILKGVYALECLLHEVSKRHKLNLDSLEHLLPNEIPDAIKSNKVEALAQRRKKNTIFVITPDKALDFYDKDFEEFEKTVSKNQAETETIMGTAASLGTAVGHANICKTLESIEKFKEGSILVASMTRPEYVPAMKKAAAIVTDEGGLLCHAAIVSRELGIPCVVGTKVATKVLKDNDLVEVRANHGLVRKIKTQSDG